MHPLISVKEITTGYTLEKPVLKNVSLDIFPGDFIGIIGPNGGGKSTLLKVILGLIPIHKGKIEYEWGKSNNHYIGYLPQSSNSDIEFPIKVIDVVLSGLMGKKRFFTRYTSSDKAMALKLLDQAGLKDFYNKSIGDLSGGQRQRVFLCRAIITQPKILILDEPNTFVDKNFEAELYDLLKELNKQMSILLVSHDIGTISTLVKTIACVNEGLHYHYSNKISDEVIKTYNCPIDLITHGKIPHRVLHNH